MLLPQAIKIVVSLSLWTTSKKSHAALATFHNFMPHNSFNPSISAHHHAHKKLKQKPISLFYAYKSHACQELCEPNKKSDLSILQFSAMANLAGAFAFLVLVVSSCLFQTEATRPSQFITITASPAPAPATSEISFPPASSPPALAPGPAIGDISFPFPPVSAPVSAPEIGFPVDSAPAPAPALDDVSPSPLESDTGYGLYGFQTRENPSTETFSESRTENSFNNNGGYSERHYDKHNGYNVPERQGMSDTRFVENGKYYYDVNNENSNDNNLDNFNNNGYSERYYNKGNGYNMPERQGMSDTKFMENGKYYYDVNNENSNDNNNGYSERYYNKGNGYNMPERQGMSDTRFMENGKYYYDVNNENHHQNGYEPMKGNEGYDGNFKYEFDSMEEYEKQHGYPATQTWEDQP